MKGSQLFCVLLLVLEDLLTPHFPLTFDMVCFILPEQSHDDADIFFYLLIVFSTVSSLYTLIWDLKMDWGLFDRNAGENTFLREEIVYPQKVRDSLLSEIGSDIQTVGLGKRL